MPAERASRLRGLGAAAFTFVVGACGSDGPELERLRCSSQGCQDRADPYQLRLEADFTDPDGDLAGGRFVVFLDGDAKHEISARQAGVGEGATRGTAGLAIGFDPPPPSGQEFEVGVEARDAAGNASNRPTGKFTLRLKPTD